MAHNLSKKDEGPRAPPFWECPFFLEFNGAAVVPYARLGLKKKGGAHGAE